MTGHTFTIAFSGYYWMLESPPGLSTLMLPNQWCGRPSTRNPQLDCWPALQPLIREAAMEGTSKT